MFFWKSEKKMKNTYSRTLVTILRWSWHWGSDSAGTPTF